MSKKILIFITALFLIMPLVSASNIIINPAETDSHKIYFDEVARYLVSINNTETSSMVYTLNINPSEWIVQTSSAFSVAGNSAEKFEFSFKPNPLNYRGPGTYYIPVTIETRNGVIEKQIVIYIKSFKEGYGDYTAAVSVEPSLPAQVDLRNKVNVQVVLKNRNILDIKGMELTIDSGFFEKTDYIDINGLAQKTLQYNFEVDEPIAPGNYILKVKAKYNNKTLADIQNSFEIIAFSDIVRVKNETSFWFRKTILTTLTNEGNVDKKVTLSLDSPWYNKLFSNVDVKAEVVEKNKGNWYVTLEPKESADFIVYENYRIPMALLIILLIGTIIYFLYRSPIVLQKQIVVTGKDLEGISEMKVRLFVKNRTNKSFFNLRLIDKAPSIATVIKSDSIGVLEPTKIIPTDKKGTIVKWDVESLEAYEERIFTYTLKAKLKIIGNLSLPSVKAKFEDVKGDERTVQSSRAIIGEKTN